MTTVTVQSVALWDVTPCSLVELYQTSEIQAAGIPETLVISKQTVSTKVSIDCNITGSF
jgi:hypothetical protein